MANPAIIAASRAANKKVRLIALAMSCGEASGKRLATREDFPMLLAAKLRLLYRNTKDTRPTIRPTSSFDEIGIQNVLK
jgi:hypothetical protein